MTLSMPDAVESVLRAHSKGAPMHYRRITELAIAEGLIEPQGLTPEASVNAVLTRDIKQRNAAGREQRFRAHGHGMYGLATPVDLLGGAITENNQRVRRRMREILSETDPQQFEILIGELLIALGFEDVEVTKYSGDVGIDVRANLSVGGVTEVKTAVQVKRWANNVSGKTVRELRGGLGPHERGLIIIPFTLTDRIPVECGSIPGLPGLHKKEDPEAWEGFFIPFVCMLGASENEEMEQFHVVNSTAKSVRTDLALVLLKQRAEADPRLMEALIERGESWKVKAQTIVEELEKMSPVWRQRIRFPGEPKGSTVISSAGMVSSLRQPLSTPYFGSISQSNQLKVLDAFWQGVRLALQEPFVEPADYVLQKSTGVQAMHGLLEVVIEIIKASGGSVIEADSHSIVVADSLGRLQGDTVEGVVVAGADFWRSGPEGAAGSFSSNAGRRVLLAKLRGALPDLEVQ